MEDGVCLTTQTPLLVDPPLPALRQASQPLQPLLPPPASLHLLPALPPPQNSRLHLVVNRHQARQPNPHPLQASDLLKLTPNTHQKWTKVMLETGLKS